MPFLRVLLAACLAFALVGGLVGGSAQAADPSFNKKLNRFKRALRSKDPKARARAFENLRGATDPEVATAVVGGVKQVEESGARIHKEQKLAEEAYEKSITDLHDASQNFEASAGTERDLKIYNKREGKISKARDAAILRLKNLENDFSRNRALVQQAVIVLSDCLKAMDDQQLGEALAILTPKWLHSKDAEDQLRFVDTVSEVGKPTVTNVLNGIVASEDLPVPVRVGAIDALAARGDGEILGKAIEMLKLPTDQFSFLVAAIGVLRRAHDRRSIAPLIGFLAREDIKRTRDDAYKALISLTGENHGRYSGEWKKWWDEAQAGFVMPKSPKPTGDLVQPHKGATFYGIHTTSDRILFIVDISGSMDRQQKGDGGQGRTKWEVCRQELLGAIFNRDKTDTFNVIFFNHQVIPWQARKVDASERNKKMLKGWVEKQIPLGGTNISDSLTKGFQIATASGGRPDLDTIFFLTDGKPTAGLIQEPKLILETFRKWNARAKLTIHAIGIGADHDQEFMMELARIGDGRYVKR